LQALSIAINSVLVLLGLREPRQAPVAEAPAEGST